MLCCLVFVVVIFVCSADDHTQFFKPQKLVVQEGSYFQLPCAPEGSEEILHFFTWNKNHELIVDKMTNSSSRFEIQNDFSLLVENVEESDRGIYSCNVQSVPPRLTWYEVEVEVPAQVETVPETGFLTLNLHEDAELACKVKGRPLPVVTWYFGGTRADQQLVVEEKTSNTSLVSRIILPDVSRHESGYYTCIADNSLSKEIGNFSLTVIYPPEIVVDQTWVHAGLGIRAELACQVYGEPKPEVAWFFEGKPIEASNRAAMILRDERHSLVLKNIRDGDLGNYSCRARSELGETEKTVVVSGLPGPAVVRAELPREGTGKKEEDTSSSGQSYTLLWTVASHSPLYEYKFSLRPYGGDSQDAKEWIIPAEQTSSNSFLHSQAYVLRGLEPGKAYQVTLQSRNRFGWSQQSDALILHAGDINDDENNLVGASRSPYTTTSSTLSTEMISVFPTEPVVSTSTLPETTTPTSALPTTLWNTTTIVMSHVTEEPAGHEDENELEEEKEYEDYIKEAKPETEITLEEDMNSILEQEQLIEEEQEEALENVGISDDDYVLPPIIDPIIIDTTTTATETPVTDTTTVGTLPTTTAVTSTTVPTTTTTTATTNISAVTTIATTEQTVPPSSSQLPTVEVSIENKIVVNHRNPSEMGLRSASSAAAPALCFYLLFLWFLVSRFL